MTDPTSTSDQAASASGEPARQGEWSFPPAKEKRGLPRPEIPLIATWLLGGALIFFLAVEGGGYDNILRNQLGLGIWWVLLAGLTAGFLPFRRQSPMPWVALGLFAAFTGWMALSLTWTESVERTFTDLSRVAFLLGTFALALFIRSTKGARRMAAAVGAAIAGFALVALLARIQPELFPDARVTTEFFNPTRLSYPINYWNGIATLIAMGVPLLLHIGSTARSHLAAFLATAALPMMALAAYFTYSRGAMIAGAVGLAIYLVLSHDRLPNLATLVVAGIGTGVLVGAASAKPELADGLVETAAGQAQGNELTWLLIGVCVAVGLAQVGILAVLSRDLRPKWSRIPHNRARVATLIALPLLFVAGLAANVPGQMTDAWDEFKSGETSGAGAERLGSFQGSGRYQLWEVAADQFSSAPVIGTGASTYEFWHNRLGDGGFVRDAHALYLEVLAELGIVGLLLFAALMLAILIAGTYNIVKAPGTQRSQLAALLAGCSVFAIASAADWTWEIAALPAAFFLLAAPLVSTSGRTTGDSPNKALGRPLPWPVRAGSFAIAAGAVVAISIPLVSSGQLNESRELANQGDFQAALERAETAEAVMPGGSTPYLQQALIYEAAGDFRSAAAAARKAAANESTNWRPWLTLARIQAKQGRAEAAVRTYKRAARLNARSALLR